MVEVIPTNTGGLRPGPAARLQMADAEYVLRWCRQCAFVPVAIQDLAVRALGSAADAPALPISADGLLVIPGMEAREAWGGLSLGVIQGVEIVEPDEDCASGFLASGDQWRMCVSQLKVGDD